MTLEKAYVEHKGVVIDKGNFSHVMALTLNPQNHNEGVIRCILSRQGDVDIKGYVDRSVLYKVRSTNGFEEYQIAEPLEIEGSDELIERLAGEKYDFVGFEDPDLVFDSESNLLHLYFTIPLINKAKEDPKMILLGHAQGSTLDNLKMTDPILPIGQNRAKELSLAPVNSKGVRLNLVESNDRLDGVSYSTVRIAIAKDLGSGWKFGETLFHPKYDSKGREWCAGHVSPGPLLPREFIDLGENKRLGIMNGREANSVVEGKTKYGMFSIGLFIYDFENGKIDWVSEKPLIIDSEAKTITFASQFVQTSDSEGILYAHVDDSFVRAYTIYADGLKKIVK